MKNQSVSGKGKQIMICPNCNNVCSDDSIYCNKCGDQLKDLKENQIGIEEFKEKFKYILAFYEFIIFFKRKESIIYRQYEGYCHNNIHKKLFIVENWFLSLFMKVDPNTQHVVLKSFIAWFIAFIFFLSGLTSYAQNHQLLLCITILFTGILFINPARIKIENIIKSKLHIKISSRMWVGIFLGFIVLSFIVNGDLQNNISVDDTNDVTTNADTTTQQYSEKTEQNNNSDKDGLAAHTDSHCMASYSKDNLEKIINYLAQGDKQAARLMIASGEVFILPSNAKIYEAGDDGFASGLVKIRYAGDTTEMWTVKECVKYR